MVENSNTYPDKIEYTFLNVQSRFMDLGSFDKKIFDLSMLNKMTLFPFHFLTFVIFYHHFFLKRC